MDNRVAPTKRERTRFRRGRPSLRITIVDDDFSILRALERLLGAHGFVVETFSSAEALLASHGGTRTDCLIVDIHLGGMNGLELSDRLIEARTRIPIVFMTAYDREGSRANADRLGAAYLRELTNRYGDVSIALAAYNWGPGVIDRRLRDGVQLPSEYIDSVMRAFVREPVGSIRPS